jgi:hypothetical protein
MLRLQHPERALPLLMPRILGPAAERTNTAKHFFDAPKMEEDTHRIRQLAAIGLRQSNQLADAIALVKGTLAGGAAEFRDYLELAIDYALQGDAAESEAALQKASLTETTKGVVKAIHTLNSGETGKQAENAKRLLERFAD